MTTADLKEYLSIVVEMEKSIFLQENLIRQLETRISSLGRAAQFSEPVLPEEEMLPREPSPPPPPEKPGAKTAKRNFKIAFGICLILSLPQLQIMHPLQWLIAGSIVCTLISAIPAGITYILLRDKDVQVEKKYQAAVAAYQSSLQAYSLRCEQIKRNNLAARLTYQNSLEKYHTAGVEEQLRLTLEGEEKNILLAELSKIRDTSRASKDVLRRIYDQNIIFPKYRNIVMVCSLYEYICVGRCDRLEGGDGAYNILELEVRLDKIIVQLDRVISMLAHINQHQYTIYTAITDANQQSAQILEATYQMANELKEIRASNRQIGEKLQSSIQATETQTTVLAQQLTALQNSSAITAYQVEMAQRELQYMNRMDYLSGRNDDVFFNSPPV